MPGRERTDADEQAGETAQYDRFESRPSQVARSVAAYQKLVVVCESFCCARSSSFWMLSASFGFSPFALLLSAA